MRAILILSYKKILRSNQIVLLFILLVSLSFFYFSLWAKDFTSNLKLLNLAISYSCLLLTGNQLRDEMERGYLDVILNRIGREKVVLGKFISIFIFSFVIYLSLFVITILSFFIYGNFEEFKTVYRMFLEGFVVTVYLVSLGLFLSLYTKGYFNFAFVFFLEMTSIVMMEIFNILENLEERSNLTLLLISLFSPHLSHISQDIFVFLGLLIFSLILLLLTIHLFKRIEIKRG